MARPIKIQPGYVSKYYMEKFLNLNQRVRLSEVSPNVLKQYECASPGNEHKMIAALRFLKIITNEGSINEEVLNSLRLEGDSFKTAIKEVVQNAYVDLINSVDITKATETDLRNFFVTTYGYSRGQAKAASVLFTYLCEKGGISLSDEISSLNARQTSTRKRKTSTVETTLVSKPKKIEVAKPLFDQVNLTSDSQEGYAISIRGKNFSLNQVVKSKKELNKLLKTIEINCEFEE